jgi:IS605 OrfB family transposase
MAKKKSLYAELTRRSLSKAKDGDGNRTPQIMFGVEAALPDHTFLEDWGAEYQSLFRKSVNLFQAGKSEDDIEKLLQTGDRRVPWAWADSIANDAKGTFAQLEEARERRIAEMQQDIKKGREKAAEVNQELEDALKSPTRKNMRGWEKKMLGNKSKIKRLERKQIELDKLESNPRYSVVFGGSKLFNAQHHLEVNGYANHEEWRIDWQKKRSGNFFSVGKGSVPGNNPVTKIFHIEGDNFELQVTVPTCFVGDYGKTVTLPFELSGQRKHDVLYALDANKPITVRCFRREHKNDRWYISITSYIADVPTVASIKRGCLGIDFNANTIDVIYIKPDGNPDRSAKGLSFTMPRGSKGQIRATMCDIAVQIVRLADFYGCWIACENLDFSKKKATLRHTGSKRYNRMISGLAYDGFRSALMVRAEKNGVGVKFVNPMYTSVIGLVKYMSKYGLNSATAAAMVIARRAMGFSENIPQQWLKTLSSSLRPEDRRDDGFGKGWKLIAKCIKSIPRGSHFQPDTTLRIVESAMTKPAKRQGKVKRDGVKPLKPLSV